MSADAHEILSLIDEATEAAAPTAEGLARLFALADTQLTLESQLETLAAQAAEVKKALDIVAEKDIPSLLDELKLTSLPLPNGRKLGVRETYIGKIPEEKRPDAFEWLDGHGFGSMVKTTVEANFGMGQLEQAKQLQAQLQKEGYVVSADQSVHPSTLGKFVKARLTENQEIPHDLFNPMVLRRAKIS